MKSGLILLGTFALMFSASAQVVIYSEDFESGFPVDYTIVDNDGNTPASATADFDQAWIRLADPDNPSDTVMGSTSFFSPAGQASRWLITPQITLGAFGNWLSWEAKSHDASFPDDYMVLVSTTDTQLSSFNDTIGFVIEENETWTQRSVSLSANGYDNALVYVAFVNRTNDGFKLYLDDISFEKESTASINDLAQTAVTLYPNPAESEIHLSGLPEESTKRLLGLNGIQISQFTGNYLTVDHLPSGIYFVEHELGTLRFVKQ